MITRSQEEILQRLIQVKAERDAEEQYSQRWIYHNGRYRELSWTIDYYTDSKGNEVIDKRICPSCKKLVELPHGCQTLELNKK